MRLKIWTTIWCLTFFHMFRETTLSRKFGLHRREKAGLSSNIVPFRFMNQPFSSKKFHFWLLIEEGHYEPRGRICLVLWTLSIVTIRSSKIFAFFSIIRNSFNWEMLNYIESFDQFKVVVTTAESSQTALLHSHKSISILVFTGNHSSERK